MAATRGITMARGLSQADQDTLLSMLTHLDGVKELFRPSKFWLTFREANIRQLKESGLGNFKRSINQNYFNWIMEGPTDNQFRSLLRLTADYPSVEAFQVDLPRSTPVESFFHEDALKTDDNRLLYRLFVGMLWQYTSLSYPNGLTEALEEPLIGNPIPAYLGGKLISQDLANSIRERNVICWPWEESFEQKRRVSFVEIGAGYGRLAYVFLKSAPVKYTIVDIPPALFVSQWYLSQLFTDKKVFAFAPWQEVGTVLDELKAADIAFLTPDQFDKLPNAYFDAGIAISNLAEMSKQQVSMYISLLDHKVKSHVYIKQWISSSNDFDGIYYHKDDFDMPDTWAKYIDRADTVQEKFFETLWRRKDNG